MTDLTADVQNNYEDGSVRNPYRVDFYDTRSNIHEALNTIYNRANEVDDRMYFNFTLAYPRKGLEKLADTYNFVMYPASEDPEEPIKIAYSGNPIYVVVHEAILKDVLIPYMNAATPDTIDEDPVSTVELLRRVADAASKNYTDPES